MKIEIIETGNGIDINSILSDIKDGMVDLISDNIDLENEYEGIEFECDSALPANAYERGLDVDIVDIYTTLTASQCDDNDDLISVDFTAFLDVSLQYNIAIEGHDYVDGGFISIGEIQKEFNEEIEVVGSFTIYPDGSDFHGRLDPIKYPKINTRIDALSDYYDEFELHDESRYLMNFIQDETFSAISILNEQLSTLKKLLARFESSHAISTMIHASAISNLESYLSKKLIPLIANDRYLNIQKAYGNQMCSTEQKIFSISDIVNNQLTPSKVLRNTLIGKSFHDVKFVSNLLKKVFSLDISSESKNWLSNAVEIRHDCVHRSGYDQSHKRVPINKESNYTLIEKVKLLAQRLEAELPEKIKEKYGYDMPPQELTVIAEGNNK